MHLLTHYIGNINDKKKIPMSTPTFFKNNTFFIKDLYNETWIINTLLIMVYR